MSARRRIRRIAWTAALAVFFVTLACREPPADPETPSAAPASPAPAASDTLAPPGAAVSELVPGVPIRCELEGGETRDYAVAATAGDFLRIAVDQLGIDVTVSLEDPRGRTVLRMDGPTSYRGPEWVLGQAETTGLYRLVVTPFRADASPGALRIELGELRPAGERDLRLVAAVRALAECAELRDSGRFDTLRLALDGYADDLALWQEIDDEPALRAHAFHQLGLAWFRLGETERAFAFLDRATLAYERAGAPWQRAWVIKNLGDLYNILGEVDASIARRKEALELFAKLGDTRSEARLAYELGTSYALIEERQQALNAYNRALGLWDEGVDLHLKAAALRARGLTYLRLGQKAQARSDVEAALALLEELGDRVGQALALTSLGQIHQELRDGEGDLEVAVELYSRALELGRGAGDADAEAWALNNLGVAYVDDGQIARALEVLHRSRELYRDLGKVGYEAIVLHNVGWALSRQGTSRRAQALENYRQARAIFEAVRDPASEAQTLREMATLHRQDGDLETARRQMAEAIELVEDLRGRSYGSELRSVFFATQQSLYDFYIDLLMELDAAHPETGWAAQALSVSERARARSLLDNLAASGARIERGADPALLGREDELKGAVNALELQRQRLMEGTPSPQELASLNRELRERLLEYDELRGKMRITSPAYAALTQPEPLTAEEVRRQVLDPRTLLLQYDLGEERSYVWAVTSESIESFVLPGRAEIEGAARRAYELLLQSHRREGRVPSQIALERLSEMVLRPVEHLLGDRRLLVVSEGALHYIPWSALPTTMGEEPGERLISGHEVAVMPSASTLAVLRRQTAERRPPAGLLAVVADPVFKRHDPRLDPASAPLASAALPAVAGTATRRREAGTESFERLVYSEQEARAILSQAAPEKRFAALGFDANLERVRGGELGHYRYVHFATHGHLDTEYPALSSLVLSLVDREGRPREGYLRLHEIYNLELPADLVVLSACQTALGREIHGEGLVGLTQGFMYAGAARVVVSLWQVDDRATAELMARFYTGLLEDGLEPAAALRRAQQSISREKPWQAPYYWAGFVLYGDW